MRENLSLAREHAKALRVALPELPFEVFKFIQQLPPSNGYRGAVRLARDLGCVKAVTPDGVVKILDFGLAKVAEETVTSGNPDTSPTLTMAATRMGAIMGTAGYMAPEQARGQVVDKRADIWSFGVVLYEMVTGQRLFHGETVGDTLAEVLKKEIHLDAVPAEVRPVLRRCLERDRRKRLRDIGDAWSVGPEFAGPPVIVRRSSAVAVIHVIPQAGGEKVGAETDARLAREA